MRHLVLVAVIIAGWTLACEKSPAQIPEGRTLDLDKYFSGFSGSFVLYDEAKQEYARYNPVVCATRYTPCSSFKIANSLIALQTGVANDTSFVIRYDSTLHPFEPSMLKNEPFIHWPHDQTMTSAFRYSVVWYYQEIAKSIGKSRMQQYIDSLEYGNRDISGEIDHFWLGSSLTISGNEQVEFIRKLLHNRLRGFSEDTQEKVKGIMLREQTDAYVLYGKTGGCECAADTTVGWFVGFLRTKTNTYIFALTVFVPSFADLAGRRMELTKRILHALGVI